MAKSKSFFGLRKGSTKSMTFSTLNGQQVTKDRVSEVRNPKTSGQAVQRMKLAPAQKFYEAFADILNHSWQGVEYGNKSRQKFMAEALKQNGGAYVVKGYPSLVPGTYPVSSGSLVGVDCREFKYGDNIITSLIIGSDNITTAEDLISRIKARNEGFEDGDKLTIVYIMFNSVTGAYTPKKKQMILSETLAADEQDDREDILNVAALGDNNELALTSDDSMFSMNGASIRALAIIHSRGEGSSAKRSNARMQLEVGEYAKFYSDAAYTLALASYQSESGVPVSDDWYLNSFAAGKIGRVVNKAKTFTYQEQSYTVNYLTLIIEVAGVQKEYVFTQAGNVLVDNEGMAVSINDGAVDVTTTIAGLTAATTMAWDSSYLQLYSGF